MLSYLLRRILLFIPTILGATFIVFTLMYFAAGSITDTALADGNLRPEAREEREAYLKERFGLGDPFVIQYLRWLNNASPIGLHVWKWDDPIVVEARGKRRQWRNERREALSGQGLDDDEVSDRLDELQTEAEAAGEVDFTPIAGQFRFDKPPWKPIDLGYSFVWQRPSLDLIKERLPVTLLLNALALPLALAISIVTGVWSARHRGGWQDWGTGTVLLGFYSVPVIWAGVMLIGFLANDQQYVGWFPPGELGSLAARSQTFLPSYTADGSWRTGYLLDAIWHLILPVLCLTYVQFAYLSKLTRTSLLEVLGSDYVRTARAKGLDGRTVLWQHGFRNALGPIITFLAALLPAIIAGSVIVERIFTIDGMGSLVIEALLRRDRELFLSLTLVTLVLTIVSYLIADLLYALADPRVSYE